MTLLDNAKNLGSKKEYRNDISDEEKELAWAWANGEITNKQVADTMRIGQGSIYIFLARSIREYLKDMRK